MRSCKANGRKEGGRRRAAGGQACTCEAGCAGGPTCPSACSWMHAAPRYAGRIGAGRARRAKLESGTPKSRRLPGQRAGLPPCRPHHRRSHPQSQGCPAAECVCAHTRAGQPAMGAWGARKGAASGVVSSSCAQRPPIDGMKVGADGAELPGRPALKSTRTRRFGCPRAHARFRRCSSRQRYPGCSSNRLRGCQHQLANACHPRRPPLARRRKAVAANCPSPLPPLAACACDQV